MDKSQYKAQMNDIIQISIKNVYQSREVVQKEVMGFQEAKKSLHWVYLPVCMQSK